MSTRREFIRAAALVAAGLPLAAAAQAPKDGAGNPRRRVRW